MLFIGKPKGRSKIISNEYNIRGDNPENKILMLRTVPEKDDDQALSMKMSSSLAKALSDR